MSKFFQILKIFEQDYCHIRQVKVNKTIHSNLFKILFTLQRFEPVLGLSSSELQLYSIKKKNKVL